jgi:DNA-binding GntR family transcriptional regulator
MMADTPQRASDYETSPDGARPAGRLPVGVRHKPLRQAVLDEVRSRIVTGVYPPGVRLLEEEVATDLDVSRNPVREALQVLAMEGFVEIEPRRGARVTIFTTERAERIFEVRQPLEGLVARLAATRRSDQQLASLRAVVAEGLATAEAQRLGELPELNTRFHRLLADAADNEFLEDIMSRLSHLIEWVYAARIRERSARSWHEHGLIVDAVALRDPDEAERCAFGHIINARAAYRFVQTPAAP